MKPNETQRNTTKFSRHTKKKSKQHPHRTELGFHVSRLYRWRGTVLVLFFGSTSRRPIRNERFHIPLGEIFVEFGKHRFTNTYRFLFGLACSRLPPRVLFQSRVFRRDSNHKVFSFLFVRNHVSRFFLFALCVLCGSFCGSKTVSGCGSRRLCRAVEVSSVE